MSEHSGHTGINLRDCRRFDHEEIGRFLAYLNGQ